MNYPSCSSRRRLLILCAAALASAPALAPAQVIFNGATYSQNFNSLASSGTSNAWAQNSTLNGWHAANTGGAFSTYSATTGSGTNGLYSFGSGAADRSLGVVVANNNSSNSPAWVGLQLRNDTGATITQISLSYTGEQWFQGLNASAVSTQLSFAYSTDATSLSSGTYTTHAPLSFTSPVQTSTSATSTLVGNNVGNRVSYTNVILTIEGGWDAGEDLWLRWENVLTVTPSAGRDNGLSIDDFSVSLVPEPSAAALLGLSLGSLLLRRRRAGS